MSNLKVALVLLVISGIAHAQWVPVTAKMRQKKEITANGKVSRVETKEGVFYRSSDGSTLREWTIVNGSPTNNAVGFYTDNQKALSYRLEYINHQAIEAVPPSRTPVKPGAMKAESLKKIRDDQVSGFPCVVVPLSVSWQGGPAQSAGEACLAPDYDLIVRMESNGTSKDGTSFKEITELYDIRLNAEPDPKNFDLTGFKILRAAK